MQQTRKGRNAVTDILSAVLLCLTAALALVSGPLSPVASPGQSSSGHTREIGERDRTPAPVESKRTTFAMEAAALGFAAQDDGKAKAAMPPATFRLPRPSLEGRYLAAPSTGLHAPGGRHYSARAPPALS